jgi:carboxylate-amine ligase
MDPGSRELRPAREVVSDLVGLVRARLDAAGDTARVERGVERVLAGTGASRQRAAYERTGSVEGVVDDLVVRTADSGDPRPSPQPADRA